MPKRKEKIATNSSNYSTMSSKTKGFIQKICYKKAASVDMTQYGFINDSKVHPVSFLLKPLKEHLEKICGKHPRSANAKKSPIHRSGTSSPHFVTMKRNEKGLKSPRSRSRQPTAKTTSKSIKDKKRNLELGKPRTKKTL